MVTHHDFIDERTMIFTPLNEANTKTFKMRNYVHLHRCITTRFNNKTWQENVRYRANNHLPCIYPVPFAIKINKELPPDETLYVIEMNNDTNKIEGVGVIKNHQDFKKHCVYSVPHLNRYCYVGNKYYPRSQINPTWLSEMETLCFKGKGHLKRGQGFTRLPIKSNAMQNVDFLCFSTSTETIDASF